MFLKFDITLHFRPAELNSLSQVKFKTIYLNVCAPSQLQIKGLTRSKFAKGRPLHYMQWGGSGPPTIWDHCKKNFRWGAVELFDVQWTLFMTFNLSIVSHETTECWNTSKYSLNRWLLHKVHHWARFIPTIWFAQCCMKLGMWPSHRLTGGWEPTRFDNFTHLQIWDVWNEYAWGGGSRRQKGSRFLWIHLVGESKNLNVRQADLSSKYSLSWGQQCANWTWARDRILSFQAAANTNTNTEANTIIDTDAN